MIIWLDNKPKEIASGVEMLEAAGYGVLVVQDELQCVALLESQDIPDLVIQDLHRKASVAQLSYGTSRNPRGDPWTSGWRFYEEVLYPYFPQLPVIICTYDTDAENLQRAGDYNLAIFPKGKFASGELLSFVNEMLAAQQTLYVSSETSAPYIVAVDFEKVTASLIQHLSHKPADLHKVSWATFEDLVKELLKEMGYDVRHTKLTRDGGVDLWAVKHTDLGDILYAIDAKKYSHNKVLGPEPVRAIYGVADMNNASIGMIVTTARFGPAATQLANQYRYRLSLKDFDGVVEWIRLVGNKGAI